jgi:DNA polymerase III alpha subunit (gram-positive type)
MINFYVLDTETTGLSDKIHEITEFSIIRFSDKVNLYRNVKCDRPESASIDALRITNKTIHDLKHGMSKQEACDILEKFFNEDGSIPKARCIVGHNIAFDRRFLFALFDECNRTFPANLWLDTLEMSRSILKKAGATTKGRLKLGDACNALGVKTINGAHQATVDSRNTFLLWRKIKESGFDYLPFIKDISHKQEDLDINELLNDIENN